MSTITDKVDVLIIGAGPAGLTAANCFKGNKNLRVRLIDQKPGPVHTGKADGLKSISLEVLDTFGIGDTIRNESYRVEEIVLWDPDSQGKLIRSMTIPDRVPELGKPREMTLDQGRIEYHMVSSLLKDGSVEISWKKQPSDLSVNLEAAEDPLAYPVTVQVRTVDDDDAPLETIHARYLIACDGARSWTRKHLSIPLVGDLTDSSWGVMDIVPKTSFPDIRKVCVIHSIKGTLMGVPREDKLVRFYVAMDSANHNGAKANGAKLLDEEQNVTFESIMDSARSIVSPYTFEAGRVAWWSTYQVGQRVADEFSRHNRVFLAGDAVHTHSPKAGQGMNTSIQDAYNIGWKLRYHLEHRCARALLSTYEQERRPIAQQLIDFDRHYLELFANPSLDTDGFLAAYLKGMKFTTGIGIRYAPSLVVHSSLSVDETSALAKGFAPGMRLPDFQMVNQADGVPVTLYHRLLMNGLFRILVFAGDISKERASQRLSRFGNWLSKFQRAHSGVEAVVIHSAKRADIELMDLPNVFYAWSEEEGYNYWGVYVDDESYHDGHGKAYQRCGIDRDEGCAVLVRPDGYIGLICELDQASQITSYFQPLGPID